MKKLHFLFFICFSRNRQKKKVKFFIVLTYEMISNDALSKKMTK